MKINIIRGQNQIGGSIIEISTLKTKLIFDIGMNLDEEEAKVPEIDGLFVGEKKYDAVFISHYHSDHIGLVEKVLNDIPVYIGKKAYKVVKAAREYRKIPINFVPKFLYDKKEIIVNDIKITPIVCDHSAFDSYMFIIEADGKTVLYTGDFRANGRADYSELLSSLTAVDALIIEGTTLSRENKTDNIEETFLEEIAVKAMGKQTGPAFILMSAMNVDRVETAKKAAERAGRVFLEDIYTAKIAKASENAEIIPDKQNKIRVFMTGGDEQHRMLREFDDVKIGKKAIAKSHFLMCVHTSSKGYLEKLSELCSFENGIFFYGMWKGYTEEKVTKEFIDFMSEKGVKIHVLHTSGHADRKTIDKLIKKVSPKIIIPVHTENAEYFSEYKDIEIIYKCSNCVLT